MSYCTIWKEMFPNYNRAHKYAKANWILDTEVITQIHVTSPIKGWRRNAIMKKYLNGEKYIPAQEDTPVKE